MLTYGDGVANIDVDKLVQFHKDHGKLATLTATQPTGRFGALTLSGNHLVESFNEKLKGDGGWVGGSWIFVLQPEIFDLIEGDSDHSGKRAFREFSKKRRINGL